MEIIEQIGSYAGLAAVLGLAVLSALYFSQARDVRRLREWAGRAPERTPGEQAAAQPHRVAAQPGTQVPVAQPAARPAVSAAQAGAAAVSATGAGPVTTSGPVAATTPAARAAEKAGEGPQVSQDTVVHPPPPHPGQEQGTDREPEAEAEDRNGAAAAGTPDGADDLDEDRDVLADDEEFTDDEEYADEEEREDDDLKADDEHFADDDPEADEDDDYDDEDPQVPADDDYDGEDPQVPADDDYEEDAGDRPAVVAPNLGPSRPATAAGARRPVPPPALPPRPAPPGRGNATGATILPPYAQSRPGGQPAAPPQEPSKRRTAVLAVVGGLLLLVGVGFGATQLLGEDEGAQPSDQASQPQDGGSGGAGGGGGRGNTRGGRSAVDPGSVTVAVLNGTTVPGLAAQIGDSVENQGFQLGTITNSTDQQRAESVVLYAPGAEKEAIDVARRLKISQREEADAESQGLAGDATVIVVAGQDQTR